MYNYWAESQAAMQPLEAESQYGYGDKKPCPPPYPHPNPPPHPHPKPRPDCPQLPGTVLRVYIPAGAVINLANLLEVTSPSGVCLIVRIPALGGGGGHKLNSLLEAIQKAGGTVEFQ